ncbi:hypothetical protein C1366_13635 [Salmonella enterica]|nr:hypothetical protein [Salmonella enterica]
MQPTKKRALAKVVLTALTIAIPATASHAADYVVSPKSLGSARVEKELPFDVTSSLVTPVVEWMSGDIMTSNNESLIGYLRITAEGTGVAPAAYLIETCTDEPNFIARYAQDPRAEILLSIYNGAKAVAPRTLVQAEVTDKRTANLSVKADNGVPAPGHYTSCVRVTGLADEPEAE